jgi:hypothetical protein
MLSGGADLISLRSRGTSARPFTLVENIQHAADTKYEQSEKSLEDRLKDTQAKMKSLRDAGGKPGVAPDAAQNEAIENFRSQLLATRQQLRQVQLAEREDINRLKAWLEFFDIALIPILVAIAAATVGIIRVRRHKRRADGT